MDFISIPLGWDVAPDDQDIDQILAHMQDTEMAPVFLHCRHGEDRTGLVVGLYRVLVDGWEPQEAHKEMLEMNFHTRFTELENYFWQRTK